MNEEIFGPTDTKKVDVWRRDAKGSGRSILLLFRHSLLSTLLHASARVSPGFCSVRCEIESQR